LCRHRRAQPAKPIKEQRTWRTPRATIAEPTPTDSAEHVRPEKERGYDNLFVVIINSDPDRFILVKHLACLVLLTFARPQPDLGYARKLNVTSKTVQKEVSGKMERPKLDVKKTVPKKDVLRAGIAYPKRLDATYKKRKLFILIEAKGDNQNILEADSAQFAEGTLFTERADKLSSHQESINGTAFKNSHG
jgi:hypothetical protein